MGHWRGRTRAILGHLTQYGEEVDETMADLLEALAELNDDQCHDRIINVENTRAKLHGLIDSLHIG